MRYTEIDEEKIKNQAESLTLQGVAPEGLDEVLEIGQLYRDYGLTPVYVYDAVRNGLIIRIAETQDRSKLH